MTTYSAKPETVKRDWYIVDASGEVLGRLASETLEEQFQFKSEYHCQNGCLRGQNDQISSRFVRS